MSQKAYTYATTKDTGNPARQLLLYVIAEYLNTETGRTFCKIRTLMRDTKIKSDRTLRNHLAALERDGFIKRHKRQRDDGGNTSDELELVGYIAWATGCGVESLHPPVKTTGGVGASSSCGRNRQKLPGGPGKHATGAPGKQVTGPNDQSFNQGLEQEDVRERDGGTDGASAPRFTLQVLAQVEKLGVSAVKLVRRYEARTRGKVIKDPNAYLLRMAQDQAAKLLGVTADQVQASTSPNRAERIASATDATGAFSRPSDAALARVRNCAHLDDILAIIKRQRFATQEACDRAFAGEVTNARFRPPGRSALSATSLVKGENR